MRSVLAVLFCCLAAPVLADSAHSVQKLYNHSCAYCHESGAGGAPRTGDQVAWQPLLAQGMDTLVKRTKEGIRGMPPRGMCRQCTDGDLRALIEYMTQKQD